MVVHHASSDRLIDIRWPEENIETAASKVLFKSNYHVAGFML